MIKDTINIKCVCKSCVKQGNCFYEAEQMSFCPSHLNSAQSRILAKASNLPDKAKKQERYSKTLTFKLGSILKKI